MDIATMTMLNNLNILNANLAKSKIEKGAIYKKCALEQALNAGEH